jgi:hypothetical protein
VANNPAVELCWYFPESRYSHSHTYRVSQVSAFYLGACVYVCVLDTPWCPNSQLMQAQMQLQLEVQGQLVQQMTHCLDPHLH